MLRPVLLFHGTRQTALSGILKDGIQPPTPTDRGHDDWVRALSGYSCQSAVFLSTSPVAGKGGDPVSFAMGWPIKRSRHPRSTPGYLVVVDLPRTALNLVQSVVPNAELDAFIDVHSARRFLLDAVNVESGHLVEGHWHEAASWRLTNWCLFYWLTRYFADRGISLESRAIYDALVLEVDRRDPALPADLTPQRWRAFLDDYFRFVDFGYVDVANEAERERRRKVILRKHGIALPSEVEEDYHMVSCRLCIEGHFTYHYQFDGFSEYLPFHDFLRHIQTRRAHRRLTEPLLFKPYAIPAVSDDPTLNLFSSQLRAVAAHVAPYSDEAIARFFWQHETRKGPSWQWDMWYSIFPADACALPSIWQPDYGRRFTEHDLTMPDRQVIATAIPPEYILGAIKVSDGVRFLPSIRPNRRRGETLAAKLWVIVRQLRTEYRGRALVIE